MNRVVRGLVALLGLWAVGIAAAAAAPVDWQPYGSAAFAKAKAEHRLILLDMVAVWCHWCHVMDDKTYADPAVANLLNTHFVPIRVDHDARPDLAERYRNYAWPATILLRPDGTEVFREAGFIEADRMRRILQQAESMPALPPEAEQVAASPTAQAVLDPAVRQTLLQQHAAAWDPALGGLRLPQKFLVEGEVRWDMYLAEQGDAAAKQRAIAYLDAALHLIDPVFGGAYQYSTHGDWQHPHYEKIMSVQADYLRVYSRAYLQFGDERYRQAIAAIAGYLAEFLSAPDGGFYPSQDADLMPGQKASAYFAKNRAARLALGVPRVDPHEYTAQSAMAMEGLLDAYQATGDRAYFFRAMAGLDWVLRHRRLDAVGFRHDAHDAAGPYLVDNLFMARVYLALYRITRTPLWLTRAEQMADWMEKHFARPEGGMLSAVPDGTPIVPVPQIDQNQWAAQFYCALARASGNRRYLDAANAILAYLANPAVVASRVSSAGVLWLDEERAQLNRALPPVGRRPAP
ncbi:DUF255 domain-containing protein [Halothiobacillus sp. DCM-1]|uniref:DUF255 domain-containing protein n=1 Tax=Halothiobacillus sp. DCM-1 TaxID=3112558 RepID=UPI00324DD823